MQKMSSTQDKPIIVSVSSYGRENYNKAMLNLIDSINVHAPNYDTLFFSVDGDTEEYNGHKIHLGSWPSCELFGECDPHSINPYQFKPYAIMRAIEMGYKKIVWCDSTIRLVDSPDKLWPEVSKEYSGILSWNNLGFPLSEWITDAQLCFGGEKDNPEGMKQIMACCIMFDFSDINLTDMVFSDWIDASNNGFFKDNVSSNPNFKAPRHDQSMLSLLLNRYGIKIKDYGDLAYRHYMSIEPTFINWGVE